MIKYTDELIENTFITSKQIDTPQQSRVHAGLSQSLIDRLSADTTDDGIICLLSIELEPDKWYNLSSNQTEFTGVDERGTPLYKTTYNGVDYLAYPFKFIMTSEKSGGEIVAGSIEVSNYDTSIAVALDNPEQAPNVKILLITKNINQDTNERELIYSSNNLKLTTIVNTISKITGDLKSNDILNEPLPTMRYYNTIFKQ